MRVSVRYTPQVCAFEAIFSTGCAREGTLGMNLLGEVFYCVDQQGTSGKPRYFRLLLLTHYSVDT
jgi:hypothetical protein